VGLNEKLIDQLGNQMKEIMEQQDQIWNLEEEIRNILDRNDDFFAPASSRTSLLDAPRSISDTSRRS
jgi:hypothetical protein